MKRRNLTLLEVLISMTLVILCALPLVIPHVKMYLEQKKYLQKVEEDYLVQKWFAEYYEELLKGTIKFEDLPTEPKEIEIIPNAVYSFKELKQKKGTTHNAYLLELLVKTKNQEYIFSVAFKHEVKKEEEIHTP